MLILVGVTVNVALNGGLFESANKAAKQTQREADREILQAAVIAALNEQLKIEKANAILKNLPDGWDVTGADGGPYTCTSPKGNIFIVDVNGKIEEAEAGIRLATTTLNIKNVGETGTITGVNLIGISGSVTWESSDETVATVTGDNEGATVTAVAEGTATITAKVNGKTATCTVTIGTVAGNRLIDLYGSTLNVGDYVEYKPDEVSAYSPDGTVAGSLTGYTDPLQSVAQDTTLKWRVLGSDGEHVLLISATPTTSSSTSMNFYGYVGYNNYENVLKDTCEALYSNTTIGATARSITMNDIDTYLDGNNFTKSSFDNDGTSSGYYGYTNTNITSKFDYNTSANTLTKLAEGTTTTLSLTSDAYYYTASDYITNPTKLDLLQGSNNYYYWVASRAVYVFSSSAGWCLDCVGEGDVRAYDYFCDSDGGEYGLMLCLRPVVVLDSSVTDSQVTITGNSTPNTWNDPLGLNAGS